VLAGGPGGSVAGGPSLATAPPTAARAAAPISIFAARPEPIAVLTAVRQERVRPEGGWAAAAPIPAATVVRCRPHRAHSHSLCTRAIASFPHDWQSVRSSMSFLKRFDSVELRILQKVVIKPPPVVTILRLVNLAMGELVTEVVRCEMAGGRPRTSDLRPGAVAHGPKP